MVPVLGF